jgi:ABC-type multidrug transport system fused ATPase/permease subunit
LSFFSRDLDKILEGIGEKITMGVFNLATFSGAIVMALLHGWELTLVILAATPVSIRVIRQLDLDNSTNDKSTKTNSPNDR